MRLFVDFFRFGKLLHELIAPLESVSRIIRHGKERQPGKEVAQNGTNRPPCRSRKRTPEVIAKIGSVGEKRTSLQNGNQYRHGETVKEAAATDLGRATKGGRVPEKVPAEGCCNVSHDTHTLPFDTKDIPVSGELILTTNDIGELVVPVALPVQAFKGNESDTLGTKFDTRDKIGRHTDFGKGAIAQRCKTEPGTGKGQELRQNDLNRSVQIKTTCVDTSAKNV